MLYKGWGLRSDSVKRGNNARKRQREGVSGEISGDRGGKVESPGETKMSGLGRA